MGDHSVTVLAAEEGGSSNFLVPNGTFFVVLIIFLIVLGVVALLVPRIMKVLRGREYMVAKTLDDSKRSEEQIAAAHADYEAVMGKARTEASDIRDETRAEGRRILEKMRARASDEAAQALQQASEQRKQQADGIAANVRASVERMSKTLARRILGDDRASLRESAAAGGQFGAEKTAASTGSGL